MNSGIEIARGVRNGTVSASDVANATLSAAHSDNTNAFTSLETDPVIGEDGLLAGVPIAVKDLIDHAGRINTAGSQFYRHVPETTAPALERLLNAGATVIGRTGLHEFAFGFSSENPWFGPVRNPWDLSLSAGGSSGGSAAAVAAGIVPIALGTDTGGSVRVPAALCGVAGLKVTHGLIPTDGVFPLVPSLDTVGAITRSLDDLEVATAIMAGHHDWDYEANVDPGDIRFVVPTQWVETAPLSSSVEQSFESFLKAASDHGLEVSHRRLPALGPSPQNTALIAPEVQAIHGEWRRQGCPYGDDVGRRIDIANDTAPDAVAAAMEWRDVVTAEMVDSTRDDVIMVTPTVAATDKTIGVDTIDSKNYRAVLSWFTSPVNVSGLPALSVPLAGPQRQPSLQLIGAAGSERRLLSVARRLQALGILARPEPVSEPK